jgi:hypothetical protein
MLAKTEESEMSIKSSVITAVVTALSVVALMWNPAADATPPPQSSSINVCVNKKSGAMRSASKCTKSERKIAVAQANVNLGVSTPIPVAEISESRQTRSAPAGTELSIAQLAGQSVQTEVSHVTVPDNYGRGSHTGLRVSFPACPASAPVRISQAAYSTNYAPYTAQGTSTEFQNADGSPAGSVYADGALFSDPSANPDPEEWSDHTFYPKDGDMDLYLVSLCAPILVVQ